MGLRLLDLFCGGGGCSVGYHRAGFDVVGVDIRPQRHYPFEFHQADALEYLAEHGHEFDLIHASPPCQKYSITKDMHSARHDHPDLVGPVRAALLASGKPYVIENVVGAPLFSPLLLCGTMFGLGVYRHRLFECWPAVWFPPGPCNHQGPAEPMYWGDKVAARAAGKVFKYQIIAGHNFGAEAGRLAMGIDWMNRDELAQAIPPAYTEFVGRQLLGLLGV
jgi:DNA (cytosine-5)-methyltransferase 1